ncbi:MAG: ABC transporter permease [Euryarchaeota archaeon]|nr:ABC transporter permease [Euryarchaeota archaeon]
MRSSRWPGGRDLRFERAAAVAKRVLVGVRADKRTLGIVIGAPILIFALFGAVFKAPDSGIQPRAVAPVMVGLFVFFLTYLLTAVSFLRERSAGTLERLYASPLSGSELIAGYFVSFGVLAAVQTTVLIGAGIGFLDMDVGEALPVAYLLTLLGAFTALGIGLFLSTLAENEFQVVQFVPVVLAPQAILGGVFVPIDRLPDYLRPVANAFPITYIIEGMKDITVRGGGFADATGELLVLSAFALGSVALTAAVVSRK